MTFADRTSMLMTRNLVASLTLALREFRPRVVIETGVHLGRGSTRIILECLSLADIRPQAYIGIEVDKHNVIAANASICDVVRGAFPVGVAQGLSVTRQQAVDAVGELKQLRVPAEVKRDHANPSAYLAELFPGKEETDGLLEAFLAVPEPPQRPFFCLDSCGATGWVEFNEVMRLMGARPYMVMLDDVNHVKHYRSLRYIESNVNEWIIHALSVDEGWAIAEYCPLRIAR